MPTGHLLPGPLPPSILPPGILPTRSIVPYSRTPPPPPRRTFAPKLFCPRGLPPPLHFVEHVQYPYKIQVILCVTRNPHTFSTNMQILSLNSYINGGLCRLNPPFSFLPFFLLVYFVQSLLSNSWGLCLFRNTQFCCCCCGCLFEKGTISYKALCINELKSVLTMSGGEGKCPRGQKT